MNCRELRRSMTERRRLSSKKERSRIRYAEKSDELSRFASLDDKATSFIVEKQRG